MTDVWFYHLQREPLEAALPPLLSKTLERGWRAVVRAASADRVDALDAHLWTFRPDAFLPHGRRLDGHSDRQPIYLTADDERPNGAQALFLVDGVAPEDWASPRLSAYERVILIFDGRSEASVVDARTRWREAKAAGHSVTYWKQSDAGRWEKQA